MTSPFGKPIAGWNTRAYNASFGSPDPTGGRVSTELLKMKSGNIYGIRGIKSALESARHLARNALIEELTEWIRLHVPRSEKKHTHMEDVVLHFLQSSTDEVIRLGAPDVDYAGYVNSMNPPIHWTKKGSVYEWFTKLSGKAEKRLPVHLRAALSQLGLAGSKGTIGVSAKQIAEDIIEQ